MRASTTQWQQFSNDDQEQHIGSFLQCSGSFCVAATVAVPTHALLWWSKDVLNISGQPTSVSCWHIVCSILADASCPAAMCNSLWWTQGDRLLPSMTPAKTKTCSKRKRNNMLQLWKKRRWALWPFRGPTAPLGLPSLIMGIVGRDKISRSQWAPR